MVESGPGWQGPRLAQLRQMDGAAGYHAADLGAAHAAAQARELPPGDHEEQRVVLPAAEGELHAVRQGAGGPAERQRAALHDGADAALAAEVPQVLEEAVADVDGRGGEGGGGDAFADERQRPALRADGGRRGIWTQARGGVPQRSDHHQRGPSARAGARERLAGLAERGDGDRPLLGSGDVSARQRAAESPRERRHPAGDPADDLRRAPALRQRERTEEPAWPRPGGPEIREVNGQRLVADVLRREAPQVEVDALDHG